MISPNNISAIQSNLKQKFNHIKEQNEQYRLQVKKQVTEELQNYFKSQPGCNVWLFGSIVRPYAFSPNSDVDIAVLGYRGSRLDLFSDIDPLIPQNIDLVMMERSNISEDIEKYGERIV